MVLCERTPGCSGLTRVGLLHVQTVPNLLLSQPSAPGLETQVGHFWAASTVGTSQGRLQALTSQKQPGKNLERT